MRKIVYLLLCVLVIGLLISLIGCKNLQDKRNISDYEKTIASITTVDSAGRIVPRSDSIKTDKNRYVGMFFFTWMGHHTKNTPVFDVSELLQINPDSLWDNTPNDQSMVNAYHIWGEPLFGYYHSADPWVVDRQIEMLTMASVDFLVLDATNAVTYDDVYKQVFITLDKYQKQGWNVPKVVFYTNSSSYSVIQRLFTTYYEENAEFRYPELWFSPEDKPMIIGDKWNFPETDEAESLMGHFHFKQSQWPTTTNKKDGFPWMSFDYPQYYHKEENELGVMSISVAQHTSSVMSAMEKGNRGRGFDFSSMSVNENFRLGQNYQGQWDSALSQDADIAFLTGWNEWVAIKFLDTNNKVFFVDTFNEEYSRDIEPMKGGYGDLFYLQTIKNIKNYKFTDEIKYKNKFTTIDIFGDLSQWNDVENTYYDFSGDAFQRNFTGYNQWINYENNTNRNDIEMVKIAHDKEYIYIFAQTKERITDYIADDLHWMNLWIATENESNKRFNHADYVINRNPVSDTITSLEKATGGYNFEKVTDIEMNLSDNKIIFKIPIINLGLNSRNVKFGVKVSDNVFNGDNDLNYDIADPLNFYIHGDSAPIGRLYYGYGN